VDDHAEKKLPSAKGLAILKKDHPYRNRGRKKKGGEGTIEKTWENLENIGDFLCWSSRCLTVEPGGTGLETGEN